MSNVKRRMKWNRKGVSEIIANILILGITVTLFSGIMYFVASMPAPSEHAYADFSSQIKTDYTGVDGYANVTIVHKGGESLKNFSCSIYLTANSTNYVLHLSDSKPAIGTTWSAGMTFTYNKTFSGAGNNPKNMIWSVMIVNTEKNSLVYQSTLQGSAAGTTDAPPIIGARGTNPSPVYTTDPFSFFATVTDPSGNLNKQSVYLDASALNSGWDSLKMLDPDNDGMYVVSCPLAADFAWNGKSVVVNATDMGGHTASGRLTISILLKPGSGGESNYGPYINYSHYFINGTYPPDVTGGESGGSAAAGTTFYYIRRMSDMVITNDFLPNEKVLIELYSDKLSNLALENSFFIYHPITGAIITPQSVSLDAFQYGGIYGTFHRYVYNFSAPGGPYIYPVQIKAKDNIGTVVNIADTIRVAGGNYPKLVTYKNVTNTLVQTGSFLHTDTLYLRINTIDVDKSSSGVYVSDIEVSDYTGRYIIKKVPPAWSGSGPLTYSAPISALYKTDTSPQPYGEGANTGVYTVRIVLRDAYQGWWLPRTNSYTVKITLFSDQGGSQGGTGEVYNQLSTQVNVTAPLSTTDILAAVGSGSFTWSSSGATWDNNAIKWYAGGEQWDETTIDGNPNNGPVGITMADLTGDGYKDVVVGFQDQSYANIVWYENLQPDGKRWSSARPVTMPFDALAGTQNAANTDKGTANEDVSVWKTSGSDRFYGDEGDVCQNELVGAIAVGDFNGDGRGDIVASFIHVVVYTDASSRGAAGPGNSWGMYFNRGIYIFWNDGSWTKTTLEKTNDWTSLNSANKDTNGAAMDIATGDFNQDGYDDIVGVYEDGTTYVWLNRWGNLEGSVGYHETNSFIGGSIRTDLPKVNGFNPWDHKQYVPRVRVADVDMDGFPDIVRSNPKTNTAYVMYTQDSQLGTVYDNVTGQWSYGGTSPVVTGTDNLVSTNAVYESITEVYKDFAPVNEVPMVNSGNTSADLAPLAADDASYYTVGRGQRLNITFWSVDSSYAGRDVSNATLKVKFTAGAGFVTNSYIEWSANGAPFAQTSIRPSNGDTNVSREFTFPASINTYDKVRDLDVRFYNQDTLASVHFSYMVIEVVFVESRWAGWEWEIPNQVTQFHNLTMVYHTLPTTETWRLAYSTDNVTWFNLTDLHSATDMTVQFDLTFTPNAYYFIRILDNDRTTSDIWNDTLYVDRLYIKHWATGVSWDMTTAGHFANIPVSIAAGEYIAALAVGDMGRRAAPFTPDTLPDIVIATTKVGGSDNTHTLFIATQDTTTNFVVAPVLTTNLMVMCPDATLYEAKNVELGDTDGDGDLDIVLVVGAAMGRDPGTGPTLWHYQNDQVFLSGSPGSWQFTEGYINVLATKGESAINVRTGNIDLTILFPFFGVLGVVAIEALVTQRKKR